MSRPWRGPLLALTLLACVSGCSGIPDRDPLDGDGRPSAQIALGSGGYEVHVIDQATGYATFAATTS